MMLDVRLAKRLMENQEGMNHLWIQILQDEPTVLEKSEMCIQLPNGVYRSYNLNGYTENECNHIFLDSMDKEVMIEIFTQDEIACGEVTICVTLTSCELTITREISLRIVYEDDMDLVEIDEQVVERIKQLGSANISSNEENTDPIFNQPRVLKLRDNKFSYLTEKYRVDY